MHLKVDQTIDHLKSSILSASRQNFYQPKQEQTSKKQVWAAMEDGIKIFKLQRRFLRIEYSFTVVLAAYFLLLFSYYEADVGHRQSQGQWMLWGLVATSIGLGIGSSIRFMSRREIAQARREQQTTMGELLLELSLLLIQPYPIFEQYFIERISLKNEVMVPLKLNHVLLLLGLSKIIFLARGILNYLTSYGNPRHYRVSKMYGVQNTPFYHIRCLFQQHPVISISTLYIFSMVIFAYCYRVLENSANGQVDGNIDMGNTLWLALLTMTTVGYGDVKPMTRPGGLVTLVSSYAGVIGTSLFVLSITNNLQLSYGDERALLIIKRFKNKRIQKIKSGLFIRICLWRLWQEYKTGKKLGISAQQRQLKRELFKINEEAKNSLKQSSLFQEVMQQQFEIVQLNITQILQNCEQLLQQCSTKQHFVDCVLKNLREERSSCLSRDQDELADRRKEVLQRGSILFPKMAL